jgi:hypothetical protein
MMNGLRTYMGFVFIFICGICGVVALASEVSQQPILYIGDSISYGKFGSTVDTALRSVSSQVTTIASCGSSPSTWLTPPGSTGHTYQTTPCGFWEKGESEERAKTHITPKIEEELSKLHPRITIVQLGTNIAASSDPTSPSQVAAITQMMEKIRASHSQCIWITPAPGYEKYKAKDPKTGKMTSITAVTPEKISAVRNMIDQIAKQQGCITIDALATESPPSSDNVHPGPIVAAQWGEHVNETLIPAISSVLNRPVAPSTSQLNLGTSADLEAPRDVAPAN